MKYVLDTNIVTRLLKGDERVLSHLADVEPSDVGIPVLVLAELLFGAEKPVRKEQNGARISFASLTARSTLRRARSVMP
ncbi:MAG TPA: PIN domain-containing protein [Polyangiaceae bacterium]|nr:PIN domain-containing protein [Polyangiaceae bacterium]